MKLIKTKKQFFGFLEKKYYFDEDTNDILCKLFFYGKHFFTNSQSFLKQSIENVEKRKKAIDAEIANARESMLQYPQRSPRLIVSLTSFPQRMYELHYCLYTLLSQTVKPDMLVLWLAEEEFPRKELDVPDSVLQLLPLGLTIRWCENLYSYKKLVPSLQEFQDDIIVTVDDDVFYHENALERLYAGYIKHNTIIAMNVYKSILGENGLGECVSQDKMHGLESPSYCNVSLGIGGILYPPHSLYKDVCNESLFMRLAPKGDDLWFWSMAVLQGTKPVCIGNKQSKHEDINILRNWNINGETTLWHGNNVSGNSVQLSQIIEYYPEIMERLKG